MKSPQIISHKIFQLVELQRQLERLRLLKKQIVFTNGVFDIIHQGHIASLSQAAIEADFLVVGLNSDASTKRLKGPQRPVNNQYARAIVMASLLMVDAVIIFDEDTPLQLINALKPDVLVKGGDYTLDQIVGAKEVMENGGRVVINPIVEGFSTTEIIGKLGNP
ncbi:MAG: D-glycero-beta-D-manno-heptose 1-phosphate adenylyltransferase [Bacteroidetes bacterium]|nr:D-glycero-beta-D-manno-heptose 1-phosphate adenylyltransferase [Bacteroidota bacterium]